MIRIALLGCGTVAGYGHLPAIVATRGLELAALVDPQRSHLDTAGERFGVPLERRFTHVSQVLEHVRLDAVTVTSPAPCHFSNVIAAAQQGCHVLCEKPLAENEADGRQMIDVMKHANKHLFVGFIYRFSDMATRIREAIRNKEIGEVRSIRLIYIWDCHGKWARGAAGPAQSVVHPSEEADAQGRRLNLRRDRFMKEGGPIVDCGVHQIDLARWWTAARSSASASWHAHRRRPFLPRSRLYSRHPRQRRALDDRIELLLRPHCQDQQVQYLFEAIGTDGVIRFKPRG
jgi:predicted dehydrogenase